MTDSGHDLHLTEAGIRSGVWIDTGQWCDDGGPIKGTRHKMIHEDQPMIIRGTDNFTRAEALERGWIEP